MLGLIFILHLPSFNYGYMQEEESLVLLCARHLIDYGGTLYIDAWYPGPPFMVWLYRAIYLLFGKSSFIFLHILVCFYCYVIAALFSGYVLYVKTHSRHRMMIPILLVLLLSVPWYFQEANHTLLALLPVTIAYILLLNLDTSIRGSSYSQMFQIGIFMMVGVFFSYKVLFLLLGIFIAYLIIYTPRLSEIVALFSGTVVVSAIVAIVLYFRGNLAGYWDQGVLYYWDKLDIPATNPSSISYGEALTAIFWNWGIWMSAAVMGFIHFRLRFYSYVVKIRTTEQVISVWFLLGVASIVIKQRNIEMQDFLFVAPPIAFYATKVLDIIKARRFKLTLGMLSCILPLMVLFSYWLGEDAYSQLKLPINLREAVFHRLPVSLSNDKLIHYEFMEKVEPIESIWILADWSDLYHRLEANCPNKYTDFGMTHQKIPIWSTSSGISAQLESEREVFLELKQNPPDWILDPLDLFAMLQYKYPTILSVYERVEDTRVVIYKRKP